MNRKAVILVTLYLLAWLAMIGIAMLIVKYNMLWALYALATVVVLITAYCIIDTVLNPSVKLDMEGLREDVLELQRLRREIEQITKQNRG